MRACRKVSENAAEIGKSYFLQKYLKFKLILKFCNIREKEGAFFILLCMKITNLMG